MQKYTGDIINDINKAKIFIQIYIELLTLN